MKIPSVQTLCLLVLSSDASADELNHFQTLYDARSVETRTLSIRRDSVRDEVHFAITLRDKDTGLERRHEFVGEGATDPAPFQLEYLYYCDTPVILLTIEYPWRQGNRVWDLA